MKIDLKEADFQLFKKEFLKWTEFFGLKEYEFFFEWGTKSYHMAEATWSVPGRTATIRITKSFRNMSEYDDIKYEIRKCAFHECCEILLSEVIDKLLEVYKDNIVEPITHAVIRRLENSVFK